MRQFRWHEKFHGIPWNSMELVVRQFRWQEQFHGIPWNFGCANFDDSSSSMEFHGTKSAPISLTRAVPWNSMELWMRQFRWLEQLHGIPWNSMELEVRQFRWHEKFHGIPRNSECANFAETSRLNEFHGILWILNCANFDDTSSSMEFQLSGAMGCIPGWVSGSRTGRLPLSSVWAVWHGKPHTSGCTRPHLQACNPY